MGDYQEKIACRYCQHAVARHNAEHGCRVCTCAANQGEAARATTALSPLPVSLRKQGYEYRTFTDDEWLDLWAEHLAGAYPLRCNHYRKGYGTCGILGRHDGSHSYLPIPSNPNPKTRKEPDMARSAAAIQNELDTIEREEEVLFQRKLALQAEAERLTRRPHEPAPGSVIKFHVQYDQNGPVYEYAALRFGDRWFTTGKNAPEKGRSWQGLLDLIENDYSFRHHAAKARITIYENGSVRTW